MSRQPADVLSLVSVCDIGNAIHGHSTSRVRQIRFELHSLARRLALPAAVRRAGTDDDLAYGQSGRSRPAGPLRRHEPVPQLHGSTYRDRSQADARFQSVVVRGQPMA